MTLLELGGSCILAYPLHSVNNKLDFRGGEASLGQSMSTPQSIILINRRSSVSEECMKHNALLYFNRYIKKRNANDGEMIATSYDAVRLNKKVFTDKMEEDFFNQLTSLADKFFGVSVEKCRIMAYEMAVANNIQVPANWTKQKMAGYDWYLNFKQRHKLSIRTPEATSMARATAFNRTTVSEFFNNLTSTMDKYKFTPDKIYNMDETGVTTVQKPKQVPARQGQKQVGAITSAERGELTTVVCTISASGNHLPPLMIFPRKNLQPHFMFGALPGTKGCVAKDGG